MNNTIFSLILSVIFAVLNYNLANYKIAMFIAFVAGLYFMYLIVLWVLRL